MSAPQDLVRVFILHWSSKFAHCRVYTAGKTCTELVA